MVHAALLTLLDLASKDADDWVETIADMYRDMPSTGVIIPVCTNKDSHFAKTLDDLTKCFQGHLENGDLKLTPEGHNIVSNSVNKGSFGPPPEFQKAFILRKKPKSFNLMNDMMKLPMKGIPNQNPCKLNSGFTYEPKKFQRQLSKREGGAKLLDICELPQSLKKRRQIELVEERKRKQEEKEMARRKAVEDKKEKEEAKRAAQQKLQESAKKQAEKKPRVEDVPSTQTCDQGDQSTNANMPTSEEESSPGPSVATTNNAESMESEDPQMEAEHELRHHQENPFVSREPMHHRMPQRVVHSNPHQHHQQHPQHLQHQMHQQQNPHHHHQQQHHYIAHPAQQQPSMVHRPPGFPGAVWVATPVRDQRTAAQRAREAAIMNQCNEMLRDANSLDQNGRQLVIAFMTGNKCNPRPELGHVITMKLSETIEDGLADNQMCKMKVETFFQPLTVFVAYAPASGYDDEEVKAFYVDLEMFYKKDHTFYKVIVGGFNPRIGPRRSGTSKVKGCLSSPCRPRPTKTIHGNSQFKKPSSLRWTWESPGGQFHNEIDHIIFNRKYCLTDVSVFPKFYTGSDHRLLRARFRFLRQGEKAAKFKKRNPRTTIKTCAVLLLTF
ncbi:unnamed protein product [Heligmosomoides polygyrus]|uniref:HDAg domain-containing protein n=1 Tax=Heligmosomoides polygyrus TaxID=6339 RepID=A0A3P7XLW3_HELPZ|nr:unnamed protein product [Heligmosomoides polygyrus]